MSGTQPPTETPPGDPAGALPVKYFRRVIRIRAEDSPNVVQGRDDALPGVLSHTEYRQRRATWSPQRQCEGLDGMFWEGPETLLFPPAWLALSQSPDRVARCRAFPAEAIGIDPAEGGDGTCMTAVNRYGVKEQVCKKTPDTSVITSDALWFMKKHNVPPERVGFDRGGGGKQHADRLREMGYWVRTIAFGEAVTPDPRSGQTPVTERKEQREERYEYVNRRAQMYHDLSLKMDPAPEWATGKPPPGFAVPPEYAELIRQLEVMPRLTDKEGRIVMIPKDKPGGLANYAGPTLKKLLGCSPDEADSTVIALHCLLYESDFAPEVTVM